MKDFTITIANVNEVPTDVALSGSSIAENQPAGTTIGTFSTADPDSRKRKEDAARLLRVVVGFVTCRDRSRARVPCQEKTSCVLFSFPRADAVLGVRRAPSRLPEVLTGFRVTPEALDRTTWLLEARPPGRLEEVFGGRHQILSRAVNVRLAFACKRMETPP